MFVSKSDPASVTLHGLKNRDIAQCREEIEQSIFKTDKFHLTSQQLLYLRNHYQEMLKELEGKCQKLSLPPSQSKSDKPFILIIGKAANVEAVVMELNKIIAEITTDCKEETFTLKCPQCLFGFWKQRWSDCARSYKETHQVTVEFTQSEGPRREMHEDTLVNFKVSGKSRCVYEVVEIIKQHDNGSSVQTEINLPSSQQNRVNSLHRDVQLNMKVWLLRSQKDNNKLIILAPSFGEDDLEAAKLKLTSHFENVETKNENVPCNDSLAFDLLLANHAKYFDSIKETGRKNRVHVKPGKAKHIILEGSKSGIEIVRPLVEDALKNIKKTFDTHYVQVKSIQAPYLKTRGFQEFCIEMKKTKFVEVTIPSGNIVKYQAQMSQFVQLSIVRGDILVEIVDGIVNSANVELAHRGGLAKAISNAAGPEVQRESQQHIAKKGRVMVGQAVCLGAGNLPCKSIIHAVAPRYNADDVSNVKSRLYDAVKNSLLASQQAGHTSIAIPALGAGIFAVPADICASASLQAVQDFANQNPSNCSLKEIRFVLVSPAVCEVFVRETKKFSANHSTSCIGTAHVASLLQDHAGTTHISSASIPVAAVQWCYKGDSQQWETYLPCDSFQLERWYQSKQTAASLLIGNHTYQFDFENMSQINVKTKTNRQMKRSPCGKIVGDSTAQWFFQNDSMQFQPYSGQDSSQLEKWYESGSIDGRLTIFGNLYSFDFNGMKQTNTSTGKVRDIKREGKEMNVTRAVVKLRGNKNNIDSVLPSLELKLQKCLVSESEKLPKSVEFSDIQRVAQRHTVECCLIKAKDNTQMVEITGVQFIVQKCMTDVKSAIIANYENAPLQVLSVQHPKEWEEHQETVRLFPVPSGTGEWNTVASQFNLTMSNSTILSIERIQNKLLWRKYAQEKGILHEKTKGVVNEKNLFHGTRNNPPKEIYGSEEGFDMRFSASGMWGQANYFAVNASYSDNYSYSVPNGNRQIFLVYVLTGDSYKCSSDRSLRMPPKMTSNASVAGENLEVRYDTVTGNTGGSDVYMAYHNHKAYPAYLITYIR